MTRPTIGLLMIVKNEERHLAECLDRLRWVDEMVITVDTRSSDATAEIARRYTSHVLFHDFRSMVQQRIFTLSHLSTDWVWVMDADERMTPELEAEVRARLEDPGGYVAFRVPRKNLILGRWVRHNGWYPDYQLRLWRRDRARYDELHPAHEQMLVDGPVGHLQEPFIHHNYDRLGQLFTKQLAYAAQEAEVYQQRGIRARPQNFVLQPLREFYRRYVELQGYKDGWLGLLLSGVMAWFEFVRFWKLARLSGLEWSFGRARPQDAAAPGHAGN